MKKITAFILALGLLCAFAACSDKPDDPTDPTTDAITDIAESTDLVTTVPILSEPETTVPGESETETTVQAGPADPTALNGDKAALVKYFNEAANRVRTEKPAFTYEMTNKVSNPKLSGFAGILNPIVNAVVKSLMPGDTEYYNMRKGQNNFEHFLSLEKATASSLKASDVTDIRAAKSGAGYAITVKIGSAVNPTKGGTSAFSRLFEIKTPQELLDEISGEDGRISGDVNKVKLEYYNAKVVLTVNADGQVTGVTGGFDVKAAAQDAKMVGMTVDFNCDQTSRFVARDFAW